MTRLGLTALALLLLTGVCLAGPRVDIVVGPRAPTLERRAARELAGQLREWFEADVHLGDRVVERPGLLLLLGSPATNPAIKEYAGTRWPKLGEQGHVLRSVEKGGQKALLVGGGSPTATRWAAVELLHHLGVRSFLHGDVLPAQKPTLKFDGLDRVLEPAVPIRAWQILDDRPAGMEGWSLAEQRRLLGQLARFKINRVVLAVAPWQPFVSLQIRGVKKTTAVFGQGQRLPVDGDTAGRLAFRGATVFENPDLAAARSAEERIAAGIQLVRGIIAAAQEQGMSVGLTVAPLELPPEFSAVLPTGKLEKLPGKLAVAPRPSAPNDALVALAAAQVRAYLDTYPGIDALYLTLPEAKAWAKRLRTEDKLFRHKDGRRVQVVIRGVDGTRETPTDGMLPRLGLAALHQQLAAARKGGDGIVVRSSLPGDRSPGAHYLARAGFDARITPRDALHDLYTPVCGPGVIDRLLHGFGLIEKAEGLIERNDPAFDQPVPDVVMRHDSTQEVPSWWKEARNHYAGAMDEMYRAQQRAPGRMGPVLVYHAKRLEFGFGYLNAMEALRQAGRTKTERLEQLEKAVEALYNALGALGEVARDPADRGVIAVLNAHGYRPLQAAVLKAEKK